MARQKYSKPYHEFITGNVPPVTEITSSIHENLEGQLNSRRKAAKMLVAVVLVFGICYFPVHLLSILR